MYGKRLIVRPPTLEYDPVAAQGLLSYLPARLKDAYNRIKQFYQKNQNWLDPLVSHGLSAARMLAMATALEPGEEMFNVAQLQNQLQILIHQFKNTPFADRYNLQLAERDYQQLKHFTERFEPYSSLDPAE